MAEKKLTVIVGAGASFDCVQENVADFDVDYRPPLTKDLFAFRGAFNRILSKYPKAEALSDQIRTRVSTGTSIEAILREFALEEDARRRNTTGRFLFTFKSYLER